MTRRETHARRRQLTALAADLSGKVAELKDEAMRPTHTETEPASAGAETAGEETALALLGAEGHVLAEVNAALDRLDKGTFGKCEGCGRVITKPRLEAVPYARRCIACARRAEAAEAH